jgi:chromate transporter
MAMNDASAIGAPKVSMRELVAYLLRLDFMGFDGLVVLVSQMEKDLVGDRKWMTREQMREAVAVCQSSPGPLAIQVGIFISYLRGGIWGAWAGRWAFILPNFVIVSGVIGVLYYGKLFKGRRPPITSLQAGAPQTAVRLVAVATPVGAASGSVLVKLGLFFRNGSW